MDEGPGRRCALAEAVELHEVGQRPTHKRNFGFFDLYTIIGVDQGLEVSVQSTAPPVDERIVLVASVCRQSRQSGPKFW